MSAPIVVSDITFTWPDGSRLFAGMDLVLSGGRTGLVGASGSGKSTLLRLLAGELIPARESVTGTLGYLPQDITLRSGLTAGDVLGIAAVRTAIAAIEAATNNLDRASVRRLTEALRCYRGALIVASHDLPFLRELGITRWLRLDATLCESDPL